MELQFPLNNPVTSGRIRYSGWSDIIWMSLVVIRRTICSSVAAHAHNRAISRDPGVFPNPDQFDPQRWLDKRGQIRTDLKFYPYGHGRRYVLYPLFR